MNKGILIFIIGSILLLTVIALFFLFIKNKDAIQNSDVILENNEQALEGVVYYVHPEDGWTASIPAEWMIYDEKYDEEYFGNTIRYTSNDKKDTEIEIYISIDKVSKEEYMQEIEGLSSYKTSNTVAYIDQWNLDATEYDATIYIYDLPKRYQFDVGIYSSSTTDIEKNKLLLQKMIQSFTVGSKSLADIAKVNRSDFEKKVKLRGPNGIAAAISKCVEEPNFVLNVYTEKISQEYSTIEELKMSNFQKDFLYSGCALSAQEIEEAKSYVKEIGYCETEHADVLHELKDAIIEGCKLTKETIDYYYMMSFYRKYDTPQYSGEIYYKSDGKVWELWTELEDKTDPECILEDDKCIYKFRNGQLVTAK